MTSMSYEIEVEGHLDPAIWSSWFDDCQVRHLPGGTTCLLRPVADQAALYGLLEKARDLGLVLVALRRLGDPRQ